MTEEIAGLRADFDQLAAGIAQREHMMISGLQARDEMIFETLSTLRREDMASSVTVIVGLAIAAVITIGAGIWAIPKLARAAMAEAG